MMTVPQAMVEQTRALTPTKPVEQKSLEESVGVLSPVI